MDKVHIAHRRRARRARNPMLPRLELDGRLMRRLVIRESRQFLRRPALVVQRDALLRREIDLQVRLAEEIVRLLDLTPPGAARKRLCRGIGVTGCSTELMDLLGCRFPRRFTRKTCVRWSVRFRLIEQVSRSPKRQRASHRRRPAPSMTACCDRPRFLKVHHGLIVPWSQRGRSTPHTVDGGSRVPAGPYAQNTRRAPHGSAGAAGPDPVRTRTRQRRRVPDPVASFSPPSRSVALNSAAAEWLAQLTAPPQDVRPRAALVY